MTPLLVLAGNQREYLIWARKHREEVEAQGFAPRWLVPTSLNHLGYKDCRYTEVGSYRRSARFDELYDYFNSHNITKL